MTFDIVCLIVYLFAIIKGIQRGLILAVFSFIGFILGLVLSIHFCGYVAEWIKHHSSFSGKWLLGLAFISIFLSILLIVRILAKSIEAGVAFAMLGWLNKLGGVIFYILFYTLLIGTISHIILLMPGTSGIFSESYFGPYLKKIIPGITDIIQNSWPSFRHSYSILNEFIN